MPLKVDVDIAEGSTTISIYEPLPDGKKRIVDKVLIERFPPQDNLCKERRALSSAQEGEDNLD